MKKKISVAIDGPSAAGKSTIAKMVAKKGNIYMLIRVQCIDLLHFIV